MFMCRVYPQKCCKCKENKKQFAVPLCLFFFSLNSSNTWAPTFTLNERAHAYAHAQLILPIYVIKFFYCCYRLFSYESQAQRIRFFLAGSFNWLIQFFSTQLIAFLLIVPRRGHGSSMWMIWIKSSRLAEALRWRFVLLCLNSFSFVQFFSRRSYVYYLLVQFFFDLKII